MALDRIQAELTAPRGLSPHGRRIRRDVLIVVAGASILVAAGQLYQMASVPGYLAAAIGTDIRWYLEQTERWLAGGPWYLPFQLEGPYDLTVGVLYPPTALALFVPFTVLPMVLWWLIPIAVVSACVVADRPAPWGLVLIGACVAFPMSIVHIVNGNPVIWVSMLVALGLRVSGAALFLVLIKPSLAPFAVVGIRRRGWWIVLGGIVLVNLVLLQHWIDYVTALRNATGPSASLLYSIKDVPLILVPIIARLASTKRYPSSMTIGASGRHTRSA